MSEWVKVNEDNLGYPVQEGSTVKILRRNGKLENVIVGNADHDAEKMFWVQTDNEKDIMQYKVLVPPITDGWTPWHGGGNPVPGKRVDVKLRGVGEDTQESDSMRWGHTGSGGDIVAYRIATEPAATEEHTGSSSSYYTVTVNTPTHLSPYTAECNDIIEALDMTFAEGNAFKAIWRTAAARMGKRKRGNNAKYDAEKVVFFGRRMLAQAERESNE